MIETSTNVKPALEVRAGATGESAAPGFALHADWTALAADDHFVQFYETDEFLLASLSEYIGAGLAVGEGAIVVATPAHRAGLEARLQERGLDLAACRAAGQYVVLDAAETLAQFMVEGAPDAERFATLVGGIITRAAAGRPRVRIFGEMVALLWAQGQVDAALHLEELWNRLHALHSFVLFCAYPISGFGEEALAQPLGDVCATHTRIIPAESYTALTSVDDRLRAIIRLQRQSYMLQAEIAERKEAEAALRTALEVHQDLLVREQLARAAAESANRMKDEFLATVSHELRTPLTTIIAWTQRLNKGLRDEASLARGLDIIEGNAKAQARLIEDLLDVSRVIMGQLRLNIGPVDLAALINAAVDAVQLAADAKGIHLAVVLDPSARHITGDASRLQQVFWNLLANAIKFTPAGGRVEVDLERDGADVQISMHDTGEGIPAEFLPFVFDRFRQADSTSTRAHGGLGLGLAIVRHLVELHGGTVQAASPGVGAGATFRIRLPLAAGAKSRSPGAVPGLGAGLARVSGLPSLAGVQVLVVDDDPATLHLLTAALAECQARVQTAASVAEAVAVLQWYQPDVLVADAALPGDEGYAFIRQIRAAEAAGRPPTPAVALTAYVQAEDRLRALAAGYNRFVPKPVEPHELIPVIAGLVAP